MNNRVSEARRSLVLDFPFFGVLALKLEVKEGAHVTKTCATDGKNLFYNRAYVESLTRPELMGVIAHEVLHCANGHHWRREGRDGRLWNKACDLAINHVLVEAGLTLPSAAIIDAAYSGMSAEEIYDRLLKQELADQQEEAPSCGDGAQDDTSDTDQDQDTDDQGAGESDDQGGGESENQGTSADGNQDAPAEDGRPDETDPSNFGEVLDAPPEERDSTRREWEEALINAARVAQKYGDLPGGIARMVEDIANPPQDWRALLRRFLQQAVNNDYTWRMPNARYLYAGLYMPKLQSEAMPEIVVAVDTSGSISDALVSQFGEEVRAIVGEMMPARTHVLACDAEVTSAKTFERGETPELSLIGGGGTDFRPVFEWVRERGVSPACLVYLTDLEGSFPDSAPDYPVLWASVSSYGAKPPFGEVIEIRL